MKKRILSVLLAFAMIFTLMPTALAAPTTYQVVTVDKTTVQAGETVNVKVTLPEGIQTAGSFTANLKFDMTLFEVVSRVAPPKISATDEGYGSQDDVKIFANTAAIANTSGELTANAAYTYNTMEVAGVTVIDATLKAKASGVAAFSFSIFEITYSDNGTQYIVKKDQLETPPSVTIPKAPITSVSAKVDAPQKGVALDTTVDVGGATAYTGTVKWYVGETEATETIAKANTEYTAKITLTASSGESFDAALDNTTTTEGYAVKKVSNTELLLTKPFPRTNDKDTPVCVAPTGVTATFGSALSTITLTNPAGNTAGKWSWMDNAQKVGNVKDNPHTYKAKFVPTNTANFSTVENIDVTVTATQVVLGAGYPIMIPIEVYYTGSAIEPTPTIKTDNYGDELVLNQDYKIKKYEDNTNVGTGKIYIEPLANGNYSFTAGSYTFTIKAGTSSISITGDPSKTYDGNVVTDPAVSKSGSTGAVTYTYYTDAACTTKTTTASGAASDGAAPKNAGDYWVKATVPADGSYGSATSDAKKFTISPRNISEVTVASIADKEYTGSSIEPPLTVTYNGAPLTSGTDYTVEYTSNLNVGTATAKIKAKTGSNFTGEKVVTFKINAKAITPVVTVTGSYEYTGDPITPTYKVEITSGGMELTADQYDAVVSNNTNAGNGNIKITAKANGNYSFSEVNETFAIAAKDVAGLTATISDQTTIKGVGEFVDPVIKGEKDEVLTGTLTYAYDGVSGKSHADVVNMLKGKNVNDVVTLNYTFAPSPGNYTGTKTGNFKVTVKDIEFLVGTAPASVANTLTVKADPTYGDDWSDIVKKQSGVTITARVGTAIDAEQSHFTLRPTGKPSAGNNQTYELVYTGTINGTNYANVVVVSGTVDVAPKTLTKSDLVYTSQITKTYDGSDSAPTGLSISVKPTSLVGTDTLTVTGTLKYNSANVNAANEITFTPTAITTGNYRLAATEVLTITGGAKITAKDVKLTGGINATDRSYVKDNKTVDLTKGTLTFDGLVGSETLDVNIPATGTISDAKVGAYNVTYSGVTLKDGTTGKASNYKLVSPLPAVMVNITKAAALTLADIPVSQKFTTTTGEKAIGAVMPTDAGALTYAKGTESKTGSVTIDSWAVDTTGKVTYTLSGGVAGDTVTLPVIIGSDNYADATVKVVISLTAKDDQAALTLTGGTTVVYGQALQLGTSGGSGTGAVTYAVTNGTGEATIDAATGKLTPVKVGTVKVKATKAADASFNEATSAEVEITITKATPTGAPKYTAITTSGKTLADAGLTTAGSTLNPNAGTLVWVDNAGNILPDTTAVAANTTYKWLFTPTDANYTTLTGSIELYHKSSSGGGGWYYTYYTIKATAGTNGSISPSGWTSVRDGRDQTFTITPDKGYAVAKVLVDGKSVGAVKSYTFKNVTKDHTIEAIFMKSNGNPQTGVFVDVAEGSYYEEAIDWAVEKGITNGVSSNMFAPNDPCTRAQIVTFLWRAAGSPAPKSMSSFTDVPADAFYAKAVAWAVENGITSGTGEGKFSPNSTCTRAQAVTFLYRASGSPAVSGKAEFSDVSTTAFYADAVTWAAKKGITTGIGGGLFGSDNDCTRGQIVTFLWRAMAE